LKKSRKPGSVNASIPKIRHTATERTKHFNKIEYPQNLFQQKDSVAKRSDLFFIPLNAPDEITNFAKNKIKWNLR